MGRCTAWWRTRAQGCRTPVAGAVRVGVVAAVLCATAALTGQPATAAGAPSPYGYDKSDQAVDGATSTADAEPLDPGGTYRSSLPKGARLYYGLNLDATSNAYVSVTAVPPAGTTVAATDGIRVSMQNATGTGCTHQSSTFGASRSPHPVAAWAAREAGKALCKGDGQYYVLVERVDASDSSSDTWGLELTAVYEPPLAQAGTTDAPQDWNSASPEAVTGRPGAGQAARASPGRSLSGRERGGTTSSPAGPFSTRCRSTGVSSSPSPPNWELRAAAAAM